MAAVIDDKPPAAVDDLLDQRPDHGDAENVMSMQYQYQ